MNYVLISVLYINRPDVAGGKVSPGMGIRPLSFHIPGLFGGQNQPVDQVTAAALLKYGQKCA